MGYTIGSNLVASKAVRVGNSTGDRLSSLAEQLSSGLRINQTSDDPGGVALDAKLSNDAAVTKRAHLNFSDGVSALSIAQDGVEAISNIVTNQLELANRASSGTLSTEERESLDAEFQAMEDEIIRIIETTTFNGSQVLKGEASARSAVKVVTFSLTETQVSDDGRYAIYSDGTSLIRKDLTTNQETSYFIGDTIVFDSSSHGDRAVYYTEAYGSLWTLDFQTGATTLVKDLAGLGVSRVYALGMSDDGAHIAFASDVNFSSDSPDALYSVDGYNHISQIDLSGDGAVYGSKRDADDGAGYSGVTEIEFNREGTRFFAIADGYGADSGLNPDGSTEAHVFDFGTYDAVFATDTVALTGVTSPLFLGDTLYFSAKDNGGKGIGVLAKSSTDPSTLILNESESARFTIAEGGDKLVLITAANINGKNTTGNYQVMSYDLATRQTERKTNFTSNVLSSYVLNGDGNTAVYDTGASAQTIDVSRQFSLDLNSGNSGGIFTTYRALEGAIRGIKQFSLTTEREAELTAARVTENDRQLQSVIGTVSGGLNRSISAAQLSLKQGENLDNAIGEVRSIDAARSLSGLLKEEILADANTAIQAQANQIPTLALTLLDESVLK